VKIWVVPEEQDKEKIWVVPEEQDKGEYILSPFKLFLGYPISVVNQNSTLKESFSIARKMAKMHFCYG